MYIVGVSVGKAGLAPLLLQTQLVLFANFLKPGARGWAEGVQNQGAEEAGGQRAWKSVLFSPTVFILRL